MSRAISQRRGQFFYIKLCIQASRDAKNVNQRSKRHDNGIPRNSLRRRIRFDRLILFFPPRSFFSYSVKQSSR